MVVCEHVDRFMRLPIGPHNDMPCRPPLVALSAVILACARVGDASLLQKQIPISHHIILTPSYLPGMSTLQD